MGLLCIPVMTIGGCERAAILPSNAMNIQSRICFTFVKSIVNADREENCAPSMMALEMSVAPKEASWKLQLARLE